VLDAETDWADTPGHVGVRVSCAYVTPTDSVACPTAWFLPRVDTAHALGALPVVTPMDTLRWYSAVLTGIAVARCSVADNMRLPVVAFSVT